MTKNVFGLLLCTMNPFTFVSVFVLEATFTKLFLQVPMGDLYEASRAGDIERLRLLLEEGANVNARDTWDSVALYYACLAGHLDAARILLERGAICSENTFDGDRCHYAALNLQVRKLLKAFEARPPPLDPLPRSFRELFISFGANCRYNPMMT